MWLSRRISRAARTTHQAHDSVYGNHSRSDVATGLQSFLHILGDKEGLAVPDLKLCKAKQGAINRAAMTKETKVDCFWLPARGSDGTSVLLNSQTGPQSSTLLSFKLLEKLVKKDGPLLAGIGCAEAGCCPSLLPVRWLGGGGRPWGQSPGLVQPERWLATRWHCSCVPETGSHPAWS